MGKTPFIVETAKDARPATSFKLSVLEQENDHNRGRVHRDGG